MRHLIITFLLLLSFSCNSQTDTIRLNYKDIDTTTIHKDAYYLFYKNDTLIEEGVYKNNYNVGTWKYYYSNGRIESIVDYAYYENRIDYSGQYKEFYESGGIKTEGNYKKSNNDSVECVLCYRHGSGYEKYDWAENNPPIKVGEWKEYYENGKLKSIGEYYLGVHQSFMIRSEENLDSITGEPTGVKLLLLVLGNEYLKDGEWNYYNENGFLIKTEFYIKGTLVEVEIFE